MTAVRVGLMGFVSVMALVLAPVCFAAADREKLLSEPGVYGTFAAFTLDEEWAKEDQATRIAHLTILRGVVEQHRKKVAIDLYLMRGLSDHADLMFRVHAAELRDTQQFLVDLQNNLFGKHLKTAGIMNGLTKKANYVPGFPDQMKADLKTAKRTGPEALCDRDSDQEECRLVGARSGQTGRDDAGAYGSRVALSQDGEAQTLSFHGLDDLDFITYFETSKLEDFHSLILSLEKVKEFQYTGASVIRHCSARRSR